MMAVKKLLLISYYWPPASGMAVQRWLRMSSHLADMGVEVHVLTLDPESSFSPTHDPLLEKQVNPKVRVTRIRSMNLMRFVKKMLGQKMPQTGFASDGAKNWPLQIATSIRSHVFIPDPRKTWNGRAVSAAQKIIDAEGIQWVVTTSPPQSVHLIGRALQQSRSIKWVADFRDPWTDIFYYKQLRHSALSRFLDKRLEQSVLESADAIVSVTPRLSERLSHKLDPSQREKFAVITNGYDREEASHSSLENPVSGFRFVYTGTVIESYQSEPFFESLARLAPHFPAIEMQIAGSISHVYRADLEKRFPFIRFEGVLAHETVLQMQETADAFILFGPAGIENQGHIPGKIFEYLRTGKTIVYLGEKDSDVSNILNTCAAGQTFGRAGDEEALDAFIAELINQKASSTFNTPNWEEIRKYKRDYVSAQFLRFIERMGQR
jgi:glycosyltransferase involved in cell wall biosynthesis